MQTTTHDGKTFHLTAQTAEDYEFMHALDMHGTHIQCAGMSKSPDPSCRGYISSGATLVIDPDSPAASRQQAACQLLSAFSQIIGLGLREAANYGHVGTPSSDPQAQEQLPAILIQLQVVIDTLRDMVSKQEFVVKEMQRAHGDASLVVEPPIVKE